MTLLIDFISDYFLDKAKHDKHFFCSRLINHFVHKVSRKVPKIKKPVYLFMSPKIQDYKALKNT